MRTDLTPSELLLPENKFIPHMPFCSNSAVRCMAGSRLHPVSAVGVFQARTCVCRKVLVYCLIGCLGFFGNPNTAVPPAFSFSPNLWWDYSSVYYLHVYPSNESSELILFHPTFHYCQLLGSSVDLLIFFNLLWALYPKLLSALCDIVHD